MLGKMNLVRVEKARMKRWIAVVGMLGSVVGLAAAGANEVKVATVDMQRALQSVDAGRKAKSQLEREFNDKKKKLQDEEASIKKLGEEFKKQAAVLNDETRMRRQSEIQERIVKFQELTQRAQAEIQQKEQELTEPLLKKMRGIIGEIAKKKSYSLVLERSQNAVLFSLEQDDLTEEVIGTFNKSAAGGGKT